MNAPPAEILQFKSELRQILHIITHSLYSHKEVFLRELISNASDAIDKARFNSLGNDAALEGDTDWTIRISSDPHAGTLTVSDNGIGMSRDSIVEHLGTIAKSGTQEFLKSLQAADVRNRPELIGQFGVGFYAAFMVAERVTVISRTAGDPSTGVRWASDGQGEFTVESFVKERRGTDVILHVKESEREFLEEWKVRSLVHQFSDFIEHPIAMMVEKKNGETITREDEVLNSRKALWLRGKGEVSPEECNAFYRQVSNDSVDPGRVIHYTGEGTLEFRVLLFIPAHKPFDMHFGEHKVGPRLYIRRVLVMDHCEALLPPYLRFVRGVVDCADLPLNVSREMLQQNPLLERIQKNLVKNVLKTLDDWRKESPEQYARFYRELGGVLKEGIGRDWANREQIADLMLLESMNTGTDRKTTFADYVASMPADQQEIYYITGEDRSSVEHAPTLEAFRERGWDVLFFTDAIDEFILPSLPEFRGKRLRAADRGEPERTEEQRQKTKEAEVHYHTVLEYLRGVLGEVKDVRVSSRLRQSAACLVMDEGEGGAHLERLMQKIGGVESEKRARRTLEINPDHPVIQALSRMHAVNAGDARIERCAHLLYDQAVIAEGSKVSDPAAFARRVNELLVSDAGKT